MMVVHLLSGTLSALLAAVAALILGHPILAAIAYAKGGASGVLVSGLGVALPGSRPPRPVVRPVRPVAQPALAGAAS